MILHDKGVKIIAGKPVEAEKDEQGSKKTMAYRILASHDRHGHLGNMELRFDVLTSHDITYVGIIQTARAYGLKEFEIPYVLTNCHNTLCAVGGTINEDDHQFGLSAARKYGGIYVPPGLAVIHSFNREMMTRCGAMILGSDSHTRYGALGTMGIGEGGGELAKQLAGRTYSIAKPEVVLVYLTGKPRPGIGPHDVALTLVGAAYAGGYVRNRVMEFAGPGIAHLSQDFRNGIDVMTTETTCLSSIWETDETTRRYYCDHGRENDYRRLTMEEGAYYEGCIELDLSSVEAMIALPMHPSYVMPINELKKDPLRYLAAVEENANRQLGGKTKMNLLSKIDPEGNIRVDQGVIAGCSGGIYENIKAAAHILKGHDIGNGVFRLSVYPDSQPVNKALADDGTLSDMIASGAIWRSAFCGPCFGAGDIPANNELSIRHTTRNFPNREGSKPSEGQIAGVALMDARSIAATAVRHGVLTAATDIMKEDYLPPACFFDGSIYEKRVYDGRNRPQTDYELRFGPGIRDWPPLSSLSDEILLKIVCHLDDPVTTTDELIPSGETSSFRSDPVKLAGFTLSRRDPSYVKKAEAVKLLDQKYRNGVTEKEIAEVFEALTRSGLSFDRENMNIASAIYARKPGDGSAREQAASCQRILGGGANFAAAYATKRYRSNCINWGILPFVVENGDDLAEGTWVFIHRISFSLQEDKPYEAYAVRNGTVKKITVTTGDLTEEEREILKQGSLINYYRNT